MIDRVSTAIAREIERQLRRGDDIDPTALALVAVEAMQRPSEEMLEAGEDACWSALTCNWEGYLSAAWPAMIQQAVDGGPFLSDGIMRSYGANATKTKKPRP